jgi:hypothetical protein
MVAKKRKCKRIFLKSKEKKNRIENRIEEIKEIGKKKKRKNINK